MNTQKALRIHATTAFTLVELLTVIAIIGILASIMIPTVGKVRKTAARATCASNLRNLHTFFHLYAADHKDRFPPAVASNTPDIKLHWRRAILPYLNLRSDTTAHVYRTSGLTCPPVKQQVESIAGRDKANIASFGVNHRMQISNTEGIPIARIQTPSRTFLATESFLDGNGIPRENIAIKDLESYATEPGGNYHDSSQSILYADGHVVLFKDITRILKAPYAIGSEEDIWTP